ncbi:MAG: Asp-tRNA(Asn)/Glu-tRNA(Gln) amidotransferase subunit GatC [Planctomycetaceae bacterium]
MTDSPSDQPSQHAFSRDDVLRVARLARLSLDESEIQAITNQLANVLDYVRILEQADTESVQPMSGASERTDVLRDDLPSPSLTRTQALSGAPRHDDHFFLVPPVLDTTAK